MKLFNYYRDAVIFPSLFVIVFSVSYAVISNFRSGWEVVAPALLMSLVTSSIYSLIMCVLSLTIFLNKIRKIENNMVLHILSWFLFPIGYMIVFLIYDVNVRIRFDFDFGRSFVFLLIMAVPFILGLFLTFFRYGKVSRARLVSGIYNL